MNFLYIKWIFRSRSTIRTSIPIQDSYGGGQFRINSAMKKPAGNDRLSKKPARKIRKTVIPSRLLRDDAEGG